MNAKSQHVADFNVLDSFLTNQACADYFSTEDYTPIFGSIDPYYLNLLQSGDLKVCRVSNSGDTSEAYLVVDSDVVCSQIDTSDVYFMVDVSLQ